MFNVKKNKSVLFLAFLFFLLNSANPGFAQNEYATSKDFPLKSNLQINPLGFFQFGPMVQIELKVAPNVVVYPHIRFSGLGLLYHLIVEYDEVDLSSMAMGGGFRVSPGSSRHRFYFGGLGEYGWGSGRYDWSSGEYEHAYISILGNAGYRWRFNKIFIQTGGYVGLAVEIKDERTDVDVEFSKEIFFLGMLEFAIGFEF